jgi:hypothetical protein
VRLRLALIKLAADIGEVGRKLLPRASLAEDRLRIPKNFRIIMDCADKKSRESLLKNSSAPVRCNKRTAGP